MSVSDSEIDLWESFSPNVYKYVFKGNIWVNPDTQETLAQCPWLRKAPNHNKYTCDIYYDRPDDCKFYPVTIAGMIADECEMLEVKDLANPKQAQKTLDKIMADSRPPCDV